MNLVKYIRKHQTQIMTIVVIVLMIAFVGGMALQQILSRLSIGKGRALAHYGQGQTIRAQDVRLAQMELGILRDLRIDQLLPNLQSPQGQFNLGTALLGQLLFSDNQMAAILNARMKQMASQRQLMMSPQEIDTFFSQVRQRGDIYWILLTSEAQRAGIAVSVDEALGLLRQVLPQLSGGADAGEYLTRIGNKYGMTQEQLAAIVAKLFSVVSYADTITSPENVTVDQLQASVLRQMETLNLELVSLPASAFTDVVPEPDEGALQAHFEKYKDVPSGQISEDNPRGFGYQLPGRVQLEYLLIRLSDVRAILPPIKPEEMEQYYQRNLSRFEEETEGGQEGQSSTRIKPYAEVAMQIREILMRERMAARSDRIITEAREMIEADFTDVYVDDATVEQLKTKSADYETVADQLGAKHDIAVFTGRTGLISLRDAQTNKYLSNMGVQGRANMGVALWKVLFAVDGIEETTLGRFDADKPRPWENLGPVMGTFQTEEGDTEQLMGLVRIIHVESASVPESLNDGYSRRGILLEGDDPAADEYVYSVRRLVEDNVKLLEAMEVAKQRAQELVAVVKENGWDEGLKLFNEQYATGQEDAFSLETLNNQRRVALMEIALIETMSSTDQSRRAMQQKKMMEELYGLLGPDQTELTNATEIIHSDAALSCFVVKRISKQQVTDRDYAQTKPMAAMQMKFQTSQSMMLDHFSSQNILTRLHFEPVIEEDEDSQEATESEQEEQS